MTRYTKESSKKLYKKWKQHLSNTEEEIVRRAKTFTRKGMKPNES